MDFREKLKQSVRVFGVSRPASLILFKKHASLLITDCCVVRPQLQSDISLRDTVYKLAEQQMEIMNELKNREESSTGSSAEGGASPRPVGGKFAPLVNSAQGGVKITTIAGDKISNNVSKTKTNTNSYNVMTNSTMNTGNTTTTTTNTYH